jgi:hypothetical protein
MVAAIVVLKSALGSVRNESAGQRAAGLCQAVRPIWLAPWICAMKNKILSTFLLAVCLAVSSGAALAKPAQSAKASKTVRGVKVKNLSVAMLSESGQLMDSAIGCTGAEKWPVVVSFELVDAGVSAVDSLELVLTNVEVENDTVVGREVRKTAQTGRFLFVFQPHPAWTISDGGATMRVDVKVGFKGGTTKADASLWLSETGGD